MTLLPFLTLLCARGGFTNTNLTARVLGLTDIETRDFLGDAERRGYIARRFYNRGFVYQLTQRGAGFIGLNQPAAVKRDATPERASRALARMWLAAEYPTDLLDGLPMVEKLRAAGVDITVNKVATDLHIEGEKLEIYAYVPAEKGKDERAILTTLSAFASSISQLKIGFYTPVLSVENVRNIVSDYTGTKPPAAAEMAPKMPTRTIAEDDFFSRMTAQVVKDNSVWGAVFLPVKGYTL